MAKKKLTPKDRLALEQWNELVASIKESSDINTSDSVADIETRKKGWKQMTMRGSNTTLPNTTLANRQSSIRRPPNGLCRITGGMKYGHGQESWLSPPVP